MNLHLDRLIISWLHVDIYRTMKEGYCIKYGENLTVREESENDEAEK